MKSERFLLFYIVLIFALQSCSNSGTSGSNPPSRSIQAHESNEFKSLGVGGGGAMSGFSINPYSDEWFVGTDMGTLFRSHNKGKSWSAVNHFQAQFDSNLDHSAYLGFSADKLTIFHASGGKNPQRSTDGGITFKNIEIKLDGDEYIKYWPSDSNDPNRIFCSTNKGLFKSIDKGISWRRVHSISGDAKGSFIDPESYGEIIYHATADGIYISENYGSTFSLYYSPNRLKIRKFTGGSDAQGMRLAFLDDNGKEACSWAKQFQDTYGKDEIDQTMEVCGHVWVGSHGQFKKTNHYAGDFLEMAENNSEVIYTTGAKKWMRQYGTKVHKSSDGGKSWDLVFHQLNWDVVPFAPWPSERLEYSAIANDIGWFDDGYHSFSLNKTDINQLGGTGNFFLHISHDSGQSWKAPFTKFMDNGSKEEKQKKWISGGIEVITVYKTKFHPKNANIMYIASADIGGLVSDDHGKSFYVSNAGYNSFYDYSFDNDLENVAYAAAGDQHDWPNSWHAHPTHSNGGIFKTNDYGKSWTRLTSKSYEFNCQYLSIAFDSKNKHIYAGTQKYGVIHSPDNGKSWKFLNNGLPSSDKIIPQIEIDPENGNVYALLSGNAPNFSNREKTGIYFLDISQEIKKWKLLREVVHYPPEADEGYLTWYYPTGFAIDWNDKSRNTLWMVDYENNRNWLMTGVWKSIDGGKNWVRKHQLTHPYTVVVNPTNSNEIHVASSYQTSGTWGNGGQLYSIDGGETWNKDLRPPFQANARHVTIDPIHPHRIYYSFFGAGLMEGPNPVQNP